MLAVAALTWLLSLCGCVRGGAGVVAAQAPGRASGAGSELVGPTNAATPSEQTAERVTVYQTDGISANYGATSVENSPRARSAESGAARVTPAPALHDRLAPAPALPAVVAPAYVIERTQTKLGAHQDAGRIVKLAAAAESWTWLRWVGVACVLAGAGGWLWSVGNPAGFPVVFLGVMACGVVFIFASNNPAWLLVLALPVLFYAAQKLGVVRPLSR